MRRFVIISIVVLVSIGVFLAARQIKTGGERSRTTVGPVSTDAGFRAAAEPKPADHLTSGELRELERLATLGYISGRGPAPQEAGVLRHDVSAARPGPTLFTYAEGPEATLIGMDGGILHTWSRAGPDAWARAHLFEDGGLLVITSDPYQLIRLDRDSELVWLLDIKAHHDFHVMPDGSAWVLAREAERRDGIHNGQWLLDDALVHVDLDGREIERVSLLQAFERTSEHAEWITDDRLPDGPDIFHTNSVEIVDEGLALVSIRSLDAVALLDLRDERILWLRTGPWRKQHEAQLVDGNLLLFDNLGLEEQSRVLELDMENGEVVWSYTEPGFFSRGLGAQQRLDNGNTLITESERGRIIEVAPAGEIVWEYVTPRTVPGDESTVLGIARAERLRQEVLQRWKGDMR